MKTICIPIDKRNECREKGGNGIGNDGDPMFSLTASMGGHFEPAVCLWEEENGEADHIHLGQPECMDMGGGLN